MNELDGKVDLKFTPRKALNRELNYNSFTSSAISALTIFSIFLLLDLFFKIVDNGNETPLLKPVFFSLVPLSFSLLLIFMCFLPLRRKRVRLLENQLVFLREDLVIEQIHFQNIKKAKIHHFLGIGWIKIVTIDKRTFYFTPLLSRIEYILESLLVFDSRVVESKSIEFYRKMVIVQDHSATRLTRFFSSWSWVALVFMIPPLMAVLSELFLDSNGQDQLFSMERTGGQWISRYLDFLSYNIPAVFLSLIVVEVVAVTRDYCKVKSDPNDFLRGQTSSRWPCFGYVLTLLFLFPLFCIFIAD